jgi:apoptosis-inducing factor 1
MFWSDLGSAVGYEAIGLVDSSLETLAVFAKYDPNEEKRTPPVELDGKPGKDEEAKPVEAEKTHETSPPTIAEAIKDCPPGSDNNAENFGKGVIFYMKGEQIVGILLWNVFNRISIARKILMSDETFKDLNEVAKLFDIFDQQKEEKDD